MDSCTVFKIKSAPLFACLFHFLGCVCGPGPEPRTPIGQSDSGGGGALFMSLSHQPDQATCRERGGKKGLLLTG